MTSRIIGTGRAVPAHIVTNDDLSELVDTNDEWICERTGIRRRRIAETETTSQLAASAAAQAIADAGIDAEAIDLIIVATSSADVIFPNVASSVQSQMDNHHAVCFDLNAACSGFLYALNAAHGMMMSGMAEYALVIGAENLSKLLEWQDRGTCILFGDGAGAAVLKRDTVGWIGTYAASDGARGGVLTCSGKQLKNPWTADTEAASPYIAMDGRAVFQFAVRTVPASIEALLAETQTAKADIRYYLLHQANERIITSVAKRLGEPLEKFPMNLSHYGNTSAASIPILLDECNRGGQFKRGDRLILSGFGAGLTWGATLLTW